MTGIYTIFYCEKLNFLNLTNSLKMLTKEIFPGIIGLNLYLLFASIIR